MRYGVKIRLNGGGNMRKLLDIGMGQLKKIIYEMGKNTIQAIELAEKCIQGECDSTVEIASKLHILRGDILDLATELLIRYSPVAKDLRFIQSAIDVSYDLYRISRYAMEIERTAKIVSGEITFSKQAFPLAKRAVELSVEAFNNLDETLVGSLFELDNRVDELYISSLNSLNSNPKLAVDALIMRHLERISDHAKEIGSRVVYIIEGRRI